MVAQSMLGGAKKSNPTHEILEIHLGDSGTLECTIVIVANVQGSSFKMFSILFALPACLKVHQVWDGN